MKYSDIHLSYKKNFTIRHEKYRKYPYFDEIGMKTSDLNHSYKRTKKV